MTIRPVELHGMIQNTQGATNAKTAEDNKPVLQQQNIQAEVARQEERAMSTVKTTEETQNNEYRYGDREGDGSGYQGNRGRKKKGSQEKEKKADGHVVVKGAHPSFDMKI